MLIIISLIAWGCYASEDHYELKLQCQILNYSSHSDCTYWSDSRNGGSHSYEQGIQYKYSALMIDENVNIEDTYAYNETYNSSECDWKYSLQDGYFFKMATYETSCLIPGKTHEETISDRYLNGSLFTCYSTDCTSDTFYPFGSHSDRDGEDLDWYIWLYIFLGPILCCLCASCVGIYYSCWKQSSYR